MAHPPRNDAELNAWIAETTGHHIPARAVCPGHDAPLQFVADFFFHRETEGIVLANRAGGKTEDIADLHLANGHFKPGFDTSHIGAIDIQAKRCYAYYKRGLRHSSLREQAPDPHIRETVWQNGSRIEILPGTEAQTQGAHPMLTTFDELEQGKRQPYENAKSMPVEWTDADGTRRLGQFLAASTRQTSLGLMQRALDEAEENGTKIYQWCAFETMQPCDGQEGRPNCNGEACPLWEWCRGRAVHADGWRSLDEILSLYKRVGRDTWEAQHLCIKPDARALIYAPFSAENVSEQAEYVPGGGPFYLWYDWGFTDPTYIGFVQERDGVFYLFDELHGSNRSEREWCREALRRVTELPDYDGPAFEAWERIWDGRERWPEPWPNVWPDVAAGDPSAVQMRHEWKEHGVGARTAKAIMHNVETGQDVLRAAIHSGSDLRRLIVHPRCTGTIRCVKSYRARELDDGSFDPRPDPDPANHAFSHGCDMLRYGMWSQRYSLGLDFGKGEE